MHLEADNGELVRRLEETEDAINRLKGELLEKQVEMDKLVEKIKVWQSFRLRIEFCSYYEGKHFVI